MRFPRTIGVIILPDRAVALADGMLRRCAAVARPPDSHRGRFPGRRADRFRRASDCRQCQGAVGPERHHRERPGANGAIGAEFVARGEPDGHLLFLTTVGAVAITPHLSKPNYNSLRDFAPVTLVVRNTTILVVKPDMQPSSAKELAARAKDNPGAIPFASTGSGSMPHLALELYQAAAGVKFLHVPYRGAAPALTDLLGGQVQALFADTPVLLPHIQGGKLKPIAAASAHRNPRLADVSTLAEQGFADTVADNWYGLLAPPSAACRHRQAARCRGSGNRGARNPRQAGAVGRSSGAHLERRFSARCCAMRTRHWGRVVREKSIKEE